MAATTAQIQAITTAWDAKTPEQQQSYLKGNAAFSNALNTYGLKTKPLTTSTVNVTSPAPAVSTTFKSGAMAPITNAAQQGLGAWYWTKANQGQTQNIVSWQTAKVWYTAPNSKAYNLDVGPDGKTSFIGSDNLMKTFNTQQEAEDYINKNNGTNVAVSYGDAQAQYNNKNNGWQNYNTFTNKDSGIKMPEDTSNRTEKDFEDFDWRKKVADLNTSLGDSFNNLSFDNSKFKDSVANNMKTQMLKNNQLQEELNAYKSKVDDDFKLVRDKFDSNTQQQLDRINQLETTYMSNMNNMKDLQGQYFNTQTEALNARVGGEQAWLQGNLSAKWIDQSVINDAMTKAREKHLTQYSWLQQQNINTLNELNTAYSTFANDINRQKWALNDADLALVKDKFNLHKTMADTGTGYNNALINNTFKPYEDAIAEQTWAQTKEIWYQAADQAIAERYDTSSPADRAQMLQVKLDNLTKDAYGKSKLTDVDMAMIKKAAAMWTYPEAIQYLINAGKAVGWTSSWSSSAISWAVNSWKLNPWGSTTPTKDTTSSPTPAPTNTWTTATTPTGTVDAANLGTPISANQAQDNLTSVVAAWKISNAVASTINAIWWKFTWDVTKWPANILNKLKNNEPVLAGLSEVLKKPVEYFRELAGWQGLVKLEWATQAANIASKAVGAAKIVAGWAKFLADINPMRAAVDIVNFMDRLPADQQVVLNKAIAKWKEYSDAGKPVPQQIITAINHFAPWTYK